MNDFEVVVNDSGQLRKALTALRALPGVTHFHSDGAVARGDRGRDDVAVRWRCFLDWIALHGRLANPKGIDACRLAFMIQDWN